MSRRSIRFASQVALAACATLFGMKGFCNCVGATTRLRCFYPEETKPFRDVCLTEAEAKRKRKALKRQQTTQP